jgi:hypothetical protein
MSTIAYNTFYGAYAEPIFSNDSNYVYQFDEDGALRATAIGTETVEKPNKKLPILEDLRQSVSEWLEDSFNFARS